MTGIIMASGFSKRMQRDKLMLDMAGRPLIEWVVRSVKASHIDHIMMVYRDEKIKEVGTKYGITTVYNAKAESGQSEAVKLGIQCSPAETTGYVFFVGDQPFLNAAVINRLIEVFKSEDAPIVMPEYGGIRGNPVIFSAALKDELLRLKGDAGGRSIINKRSDEVEIVRFEDRMLGKDIDTWDEYMKWS